MPAPSDEHCFARPMPGRTLGPMTYTLGEPAHIPGRAAVSRRSFLALTAAGAASAAAPCTARPPMRREAARPIDRPARNVIFMVSDGMSTGTLTLADMASRSRLNRPSNWVSLWRREGVHRASAFTASADSAVTDSAAGGCAWGCGRHVNNEVLNILPDGTEMPPILLQAKPQGRATGVVTTARITHATPASFYANCPSRDREKQIAAQLVERPIDLALGGGARYFAPSALEPSGPFTVVRTRDGMLGVRDLPEGKRLLGLFADEHIPFELDRSPSVPTLAEMSSSAMRLLDSRPNGFVLQIEGGRIDHAAHHNDAPSLIAEQLAFDEAIGSVLEFLKGRDDTLLVLTTDHGNANPGLTFYGPGGAKRFARLANAKHSFEWIFEKLAKTVGLKDQPDKAAAALRDLVGQATGVSLDPAETAMLAGVLGGKRVSPFAESNKPETVLGAILADTLGVAFLSPNHTSDMVEVTALGPGSESLHEIIDNVELWNLMVGALALEPAK